MRIVKHFFRALVLLSLLVLIAYGVYYYQVKSAIDSHLQQMHPLVDAQYKSLYVNPLGDIHLNTVAVTPMGQASGFVIDSVRLTSSDPLFFLGFESRIADGNWPESLTLAVEGLIIDFNMPLLLMLEQFAQPGEVRVQPAAFGCGTIRNFDMTALRMMGMRHGHFDLHANLRKASRDQLELELLGSMHGWADLALHVSIQADNASPQAFSRLGPQVHQLSFSYQDKGYNQRKNQFCSMQSGMTVAEYREAHLSLINSWLEDEDPGLATLLMPAYKQIGETGARMVLNINLGGMDFQNVATPGYMERMLADAMSVSVNEQPLRLNATQLNSLWAMLQEPDEERQAIPDQSASDIAALSDMPRNMPGVASPPVPERSNEPLRYRKTAPLELVNYVGHPVRFYTSFGKRVEGILLSVEDGSVRVAERVQHGTAQYPIELDALQDTEVFR